MAPSTAGVVTAEALGACCAIEPAAIARAVAGLLDRPAEERAALRRHCRAVALERYTWERQQAGLVRAYRALAGRVGLGGAVEPWAGATVEDLPAAVVEAAP